MTVYTRPLVGMRCALALASLAPLGTGCTATDSAGDYSGAEYDGDDGGATGAGAPQGDAGDDGGVDDEPPIVDPTGEPAVCNDADDVTLYLSPDDSNSMSSPVQARASVLGSWGGLGSVDIRPWEFLNYYGFDYPAAEPGSVGVHASMLADPELPGEYLLQIGIASEAMANDRRPPMNLTFVLDTSGSMAGVSLEMMQESCRRIAGNLGEGDVVSMVTWDTDNAIVIANHMVGGPDDPTLLAAIDGLQAGGGTNLHAGLVAGYGLAEAAHRPGVVSRVLLVSDGGANVGITDVEVIAAHAGGQGEDGIYLVGVGVGSPQTYNDALMDAVTDAGKGASVFVPDADEAGRVFGERFVSTMAVAARNVGVRLDLPPGFEVIRFSGEEISTDPDEVEPQHLAPDDTMVFHQRLSTCVPEAVFDDSPVTITVRYEDAVSFETREVVHETTFAALLGQDPALLLEGAAVFEYATALAAWQQGDATAELAAARAALARALEHAPQDSDLLEIQRVLAELG